MNRKNLINRILCAVLILALAAGAAVAAVTGGRTSPEDPLDRRAQTLNADPVDGGSSSQRREWQEREDTAPEQEETEPADAPQEEEPHKEEQPEDREQPDRKTEPPPSGQTEPGEGQGNPDDPELPDRQDDTPGASGDETGPGGGDAAGEDRRRRIPPAERRIRTRRPERAGSRQPSPRTARTAS